MAKAKPVEDIAEEGKIPIVKKIVYAILLLVPLALAIAWLYAVKATEKALGVGQGTFFSPSSTMPLIIGLVIFIVGYIVFLVLMFHENIREVFAH